jgi:hypothetical protein
MHTTTHQNRASGKRHSFVLPLADFVMSCHLAPQFRRLDPEIRLKPSLDLLTVGRSFFFNQYYNYYVYLLLEHWRRIRARR